MGVEVQFPVSPWENNYMIVKPPFRKKRHHSYYPPTPIQNMIAYSYLEKLANYEPHKVEYANDAYSFIIKDNKVLDSFCNIIVEPLAKTIVTAMKEHKLIHIKHLSEDQILSVPLYMSLQRVVVEPEYTKLTERRFFVIECKKFSNNNPYGDKDVILSNICVMGKLDESYADFVLKALNLVLFGKSKLNNIKLWNKIKIVVNTYFLGNTWPIILLMLVSAIRYYRTMMFFFLYNNSPEFQEVFRVAGIYKGNNPKECERKAESKDFLSIVGLRETSP